MPDNARSSAPELVLPRTPVSQFSRLVEYAVRIDTLFEQLTFASV